MKTSTNLLELWNVGLVDFVKQLKDGTYEPVEWAKQATHYLVPTSLRSTGSAFTGTTLTLYAYSVCAVPLHHKVRLAGPVIKAERRLPVPRKVYYGDGGVEGKRAVLRWMIWWMDAKVSTLVSNLDSTQCDTLYRNLIVTHNSL